MNRLKQRAVELALDAQRRRIPAIAERLRERLQGIGVTENTGAIALTGYKLIKRWLTEPELRFLVEPRR